MRLVRISARQVTGITIHRWVGIASFLWFGAVLIGAGCGPQNPPPSASSATATEAQLSPQAVLDEWKGLVSKPEENMDNPRCVVLASMLAAQAPDLLNVMIDLLVDPATSPQSKLIILTSLESVLQPGMAPRLLQLTDPGVDGSVRSGVTMLLASINDPNVTARFKELVNDSDRRVRLAALNGLALRGDEPARERLREVYFEADTPPPFRERIALTFAVSPQPADVKLLSDALGIASIQPSTRMRIAGALGMLADPASLPALNACLEGDNPEDLKAMVRDSVAAIQAKQTPALP